MASGPTILPRSSISLGEELGRGGFAVVYLGEYPIGEKNVAVKILSHDCSLAATQEFLKEVSFMASYQHERLVSLVAVCLEDPSPCMIMELLHCSLDDLLHRDSETCLTWRDRMILIRDVGEGLLYLHENGAIHRDLKSKNVLIYFEGSRPRGKLADFGLSRKLNLKGKGETCNHDAGTLKYMAPELHANEPCSSASDVFAFGLLMFEIAHRQDPWVGQEFSVFALIKRDMRPLYQHEALPELPQFFDDLMVACWADDPSLRPPIEFALETLNTNWGILPPGVEEHENEQRPGPSTQSDESSLLPDDTVSSSSSTSEPGFSSSLSIVPEPEPWYQTKRVANATLSFEAAAQLSISDLSLNGNQPRTTVSPRDDISSPLITPTLPDSASPHPVFQPDWKEATSCNICQILFGNGIINPRRHHCRACGNSCCHACSPTYLHLDKSSGLLRVCNQCVPVIESDIDRLAIALQPPLVMAVQNRAEESPRGTGVVYSYFDLAVEQPRDNFPFQIKIQSWGLIRGGHPRVVIVNPENETLVMPLVTCQDLTTARRYVRFCQMSYPVFRNRHPDASLMEFYHSFDAKKDS